MGNKKEDRKPTALEYGQCRCMYDTLRDPGAKSHAARWFIGGFGMFDIAYHGDYAADYEKKQLDPEKIELFDVPQGFPGTKLVLNDALDVRCDVQGLGPSLDKNGVHDAATGFAALEMAMKVIQDVVRVEFPADRVAN